MPLILKRVEPLHGLRWVRDGFALFMRKPLAFAGMFVLFLVAVLVLSFLRNLGGLVQMMLLPLLSLGFMVAGQSALLGGPVGPAHFWEPLRGEVAKRRALLVMCLIYGVAAVAILLLCDAISDNALNRLQRLAAKAGAKPQDIYDVLMEPGVFWATTFGTLSGTLLSVLFWHAPALVHWGGQGVGQSIFSSALAVWRSKGAFTVYSLAWMMLILFFGVATAFLFDALGIPQMATSVAMPAALMFSTVFYISVLFTFNDSFSGVAAAAQAEAGHVES
jgi:hypothetical protein